MGIRKIGVGLTALGVVATVCLAGAAASTPGPKVSEVGPGIYSVQDLPVAEDGSESEQAVEKINRFKASNADEWTHRQILASATAHSDLGSGAAKDLLKEAFGTQLSDLLVDPFQVLRSAEEIVSFRDDYTAIIDPAGPADRALVVSTSPLRTDGGKLPNLDLKPAGSSIRVKEPTTEVEFSKVPGEGIELPQSELSLAFDDVGAQAPDATVITTDGPGSSRVVFYPNAMEDTDLVAAPLANGVETFAHLRSEHSPEQLKVRIDAPTGGSVSPAEGGGAVISDHDGNQVAQVYPPSALDTAGSTVPVTMSVEDSVLLLEVPHKNRGFAYPIWSTLLSRLGVGGPVPTPRTQDGPTRTPGTTTIREPCIASRSRLIRVGRRRAAWGYLLMLPQVSNTLRRADRNGSLPRRAMTHI